MRSLHSEVGKIDLPELKKIYGRWMHMIEPVFIIRYRGKTLQITSVSVRRLNETF